MSLSCKIPSFFSRSDFYQGITNLSTRHLKGAQKTLFDIIWQQLLSPLPSLQNYVILTLQLRKPLGNDYAFFVLICMILLRSFLT